jgi:hypothetical protein
MTATSNCRQTLPESRYITVEEDSIQINSGYFATTATATVLINEKKYAVTCNLTPVMRDAIRAELKGFVTYRITEAAMQLAALAVIEGVGSTFQCQKERFWSSSPDPRLTGGIYLEGSENDSYTKRLSLTLDLEKDTMYTKLSPQYSSHKVQKESKSAPCPIHQETRGRLPSRLASKKGKAQKVKRVFYKKPLSEQNELMRRDALNILEKTKFTENNGDKTTLHAANIKIIQDPCWLKDIWQTIKALFWRIMGAEHSNWNFYSLTITEA